MAASAKTAHSTDKQSDKSASDASFPAASPSTQADLGLMAQALAQRERLGNHGFQSFLRDAPPPQDALAVATLGLSAFSASQPPKRGAPQRATPAQELEADAFAVRAVHQPVPAGGSLRPAYVLSDAERQAAPAALSDAIRAPGRRLDGATRAYFEPRLGVRLDAVRVHTGETARRSARVLGVRAYAYGEHLVFDSQSYAPHTASGRALLAHELAHVAQQARAQHALLGYDDPARKPLPGETTTEVRPGLIERRAPGFFVLEAGGRNWVMLQWDPALGTPHIEAYANDTPDATAVGIRVTASFQVRAKIDRSIEQAGSDLYRTFFYRLFSYDFRFPGTLEVVTGPPLEKDQPIVIGRHTEQVALPYRHREFYEPEPSLEFRRDILLNPPTAESLDPLRGSPPPSKRPDQLQVRQEEQSQEDLIRGQPSFATRAEMEDYIRAHPNESFIGIATSYGRFVARRVDEDELQRVAAALREDADNLPEVAWGAAERRSAWSVTGIYQNGRMVDLEHFANLYYGEDFFARIGRGGEFEEAEVFRVGKYSFGRKPLSHDEALARWAELDAKTSSEILRLETESGRPFVSLLVRGVGQAHELDQRYFRGRDAFNQRILRLADTDAGVATLEIQIDSGPDSDDMRYFLFTELDREQKNPAFVAALRRRDKLAEAVSAIFYNRVVWRAQNLAIEQIIRGAEQLRPYAEDVERMRPFALGFPQMDQKQRADAMGFIGVPENERGYVEEILSSPERAARVALGIEESVTKTTYMQVPDDLPSHTTIRIESTHSVSLEKLMGWARDTVAGLDKAVEQLHNRDVEALWLDGELGNTIRAQVYREFGFTLLDPKRFPHRDETSGWFPDPLDTGPLAFSSLAEQMYANGVHHEANVRRVLHVLKVTGLVILAIVLILIAQEAGAIAAGYLFAEGTAAYIATELVVSGLVYTGLSEVQTRVLEGHWESESIGDLVGHGVRNIATFGAFRFLNTLLAAGARAFVAGRVGEEVFVASRGAQRAAEALRITGVGATFLTIGIVQRLASGQGFSSAGDFALFAYENLLTLALLEGGAVLARPLMTRGTMWAREQRLGEFETEITALRGDVARLQFNLASLSRRPQAAAREAPELANQTRRLLETQRGLCERLREKFRNRGDAKVLEAEAGRELQRINDALAGIHQAEFLTQQRVVPVEGSESVFTYEGGSAGVERFRQFYGADRVHAAEDGSIRVEVPGLEDRDLVFVPAERFAAPAGGGAPPQVPTIVQRQVALRARQQALLTRAQRLGVRHASLDAIRSLRPARSTVPETLDRTEQAIARAEREAGAEMDRLARNILQNVRGRLGAGAVDQIRAGELAVVSDAELADVLWQARGLQDMGVAQLRALVFAGRAGEPAIDVAKLLRTARRGRFGVDSRNFALETFTHLMELGVPGARQMLADMSTSPGHFRGGMFQMEVIRYVGGVEQVAGIEVRTQIGARAREYDIILRDGTRIECKDWATWEYADSLADAFERDMLSLTSNFASPSGLRHMRYFFRLIGGRPIRPVPEIRAFLRARLERVLSQRGANDATRKAMLKEFDDFLDMVQAPDLQRTGGLPLPSVPVAPPSPALPRRDEEESETLDISPKVVQPPPKTHAWDVK